MIQGTEKSEVNGIPLECSLTLESPLVNEIIPVLALAHGCFIFLFSFYLRRRRLLVQLVLRVSQCVTSVSCMALESV